MYPSPIVKFKIVFQPLVRLFHGLKIIQVDFLVLDRTPQTLNKDIIQGPASAIHANLDAFIQQGLSEPMRSKLAPVSRQLSCPI